MLENYESIIDAIHKVLIYFNFDTNNCTNLFRSKEYYITKSLCTHKDIVWDNLDSEIELLISNNITIYITRCGFHIYGIEINDSQLLEKVIEHFNSKQYVQRRI